MKSLIFLTVCGMGTVCAAVYQGSEADDSILGDAANDWILLAGGNDLGQGGAGNDFLAGGSGSDVISGDAGDDILMGGSPAMLADTASNIITGGSGNDLLFGGNYGDSYIYNLGDGFDTIREAGSNVGEVDRIIFGSGIATSLVTFSRENGDLVVEYLGADILKIDAWFGSSNGSNCIEEFRFESDPIILGNTLAFDGIKWNGTQNSDTYTHPFSSDGWLLGQGGNDGLTGASGADVIVGGTGNDNLSGKAGNDGLFGEEGSDVLFGGDGNDQLSGGDGNDTLFGESGNDTLNGGVGADTLNGGAGNDIYTWNLGDGDDVINDDLSSTGQGALNRLIFDPGILPADVTAETVSSSSQHIKFVVRQNGVVSGSVIVTSWTYVYSGPQHKDTWRIEFSNGVTWDGTTLATLLGDTLNGTSFADTLNGGAGNDTLNGLDGDDILNGDGDNDTLNGGNGHDNLSGGTGSDVLNGNSGNDQLNGGAGNDTLNGGAGNDIYTWNLGDGDDVINDDSSSTGQGALNRLIFDPGILPADVTAETVSYSSQHIKFVVRQNGVVSGSVIVTSWTYVYSGPQHKDTWRIEFSNGVTWDGTTLATLLGDTLNGTSFADTLNGGAGNDTLNGLDGDDILNGDGDNDTLNGGNGHDNLSGGTGSDVLNGNSGNDQLNGGAGNDTLNGGTGNDIYTWNLGDGDDVIVDDWTSPSPFGVNRLVFGPSIQPGDVTTETVPGNSGNIKFVIRQNGVASGSVVINQWTNSSSSVRHATTWRLEFVNGTTWDGTTLTTALGDLIAGTPLSDVINGGGGNDTLNGLDGDDTLNGDADNDILNGGNGSDSLNGGIGLDILNGDGGNDLLNGGEADDTLNGGTGDDTLNGGTGNDSINGNEGNDQLSGEAGNDILQGGSGNDLYKWNVGDGDDTISDDWYLTGEGAVNRLVFGSGILPSDVVAEVAPSGSRNIKFVVRQGGVLAGSIIINFWTYVYSSANHATTWRIDFANGTSWNGATLTTPLNDTFIGTALADTLNGGAGNDTLNGLGGDDILNGDADNDTLNGGDGNDMLNGSAGNDTLNGGVGNDILDGGSGSDLLNGGTGNDTYLWNYGDGDDVIADDYLSTGQGAINRLVFGPGILASDVTAVIVPSNSSQIRFVFRQNGLISGSVIVDYWTIPYGPAQHKDTWRIEFADGGRYYLDVLPTSGNDIIIGTGEADKFYGYAGNDALIGNGGDDVLSGGLGNDSLAGGLGSDTYQFSRGDGRDIVIETPEPNSNNVIILGAGILPSQMSVIRSQNSLVLIDHLSETTLELTSWWPLVIAPIQKVVFANGVEWTPAELTAMASTTSDFNHDGISDTDAFNNGISIITNDLDGDGIANETEVRLGLNSASADSDGDGISDLLDTDLGSGGSSGSLLITLQSPASAVLSD